MPFLESGEFWNTVVSFHKTHPTANFCLPVMDFYWSCLFLPLGSYPTCHSCLMLQLHLPTQVSWTAILSSPRAFAHVVSFPVHVSSSLLVPSGSAQRLLPLRGLPWPLFSNSTPQSATSTSCLVLALPQTATGQRARYITLTSKLDLSCLLHSTALVRHPHPGGTMNATWFQVWILALKQNPIL